MILSYVAEEAKVAQGEITNPLTIFCILHVCSDLLGAIGSWGVFDMGQKGMMGYTPV